MQENHIDCVEMNKNSYFLLKKYNLAGNGNRKSYHDARKKMGSIATLKLTKLYKLKFRSRLGLNSINYAKILLNSRMYIKIKERR